MSQCNALSAWSNPPVVTEKYAGLFQSGNAGMRRPRIHEPRSLGSLRNLPGRFRLNALAHQSERPGTGKGQPRSSPRLVDAFMLIWHWQMFLIKSFSIGRLGLQPRH